MEKQVKGLTNDIELAQADIDRRNAKVSKLREEISNLQGENLLTALDIKAAQQLIEKLSSI